MTRFLKINNCSECPHREVRRTPGTGFGLDWICTKMARVIAGYIEWPSEEPKTVPDWCPLPEKQT